MKDRPRKKVELSWIRLLAAVAALFTVELLIMRGIQSFPEMPALLEALIDSTALVTFSLPVLYLLFLKPLAEELATRKKAEEELKTKIAHIQLMQEITLACAGHSGLRDVMATLLEKICRSTGWEGGHIYFPGENGKLVPSGIWYLENPERFGTFRRITQSTTFEKGKGLPGMVWESGGPLWMRDVESEDAFIRAKNIPDIEIKSACAFPLMEGEKLAAVLEFFSSTEMAEDPATLGLLDYLAAQLGRITERKKAEEEITRGLRKYETLVKNISGAIYTLSLDGSLVFASEGAERLTGRPAGELVTSPDIWEGMIHDEEREKFRIQRRKLVEERVPMDIQYRMKKEDGSLLWVHDRCGPVTAPDGGVEYFQGMLDDITSIKEAERIQEEFFRTVIHDLRSPLGGAKLELDSIPSYLDSIRECVGGLENEMLFSTYRSAVEGKLASANEGLDRAYEMISSLLEAGEMKKEKLRLNYQVFDMRELLDEIREEVAPRLAKKSLKLEIKNGVNGDVVSDRNLIKRALLNIIDNAAKYGFPYTEITVDAGTAPPAGDGERILVSVSNIGEKLSADRINSLLLKLKSLDEPEKGSGAGLFFCCKALDLLEGGIHVDAEENRTTFHVHFPNG